MSQQNTKHMVLLNKQSKPNNNNNKPPQNQQANKKLQQIKDRGILEEPIYIKRIKL